MSDPASKLATYEDLFDLPEDARVEIIAGQIEMLPSARFEHGNVGGRLFSDVETPYGRGRGGPGEWWITQEFDVRFDRHNVVRPDLVGWRRERMPTPPSLPPADVRPDWICEVLSPSNEKHDRHTKKALYARFGVPHYWIVDPQARILEAFALQESGLWLSLGSYSDGDKARIEPFEAIELDLDGILPTQVAANADADAKR